MASNAKTDHGAESVKSKRRSYLVPVLLAVTGLLLIGLVYILLSGKDIGDYGTFIQALIAAILVSVTAFSIDRADKQIEISQRQFEVSQQQLQATIDNEKYHTLILGVTPDLKAEIANISRYAIYIHRIVNGYRNRDGFISLIPKKHVLLPGEITELENLFDGRLKSSLQAYADAIAVSMVAPDEYKAPDPLGSVVSITYQYGGTGSTLFTQDYSLEVDAFHPYIVADDRMWSARFKPDRAYQWPEEGDQPEDVVWRSSDETI